MKAPTSRRLDLGGRCSARSTIWSKPTATPAFQHARPVRSAAAPARSAVIEIVARGERSPTAGSAPPRPAALFLAVVRRRPSASMVVPPRHIRRAARGPVGIVYITAPSRSLTRASREHKVRIDERLPRSTPDGKSSDTSATGRRKRQGRLQPLGRARGAYSSSGRDGRKIDVPTGARLKPQERFSTSRQPAERRPTCRQCLLPLAATSAAASPSRVRRV